jgi:hypothetical protein
LYFYLVDNSDAITSWTGETGVVWISVNGGAFTTTGVGSLKEVGGSGLGKGYYYAEVDTGTLTNGSIVTGHCIPSGLAVSTPALNQLQVVPWDPYDNFHGATFNASTDSLEAISDVVRTLVGVTVNTITLSSAAGNFISNLVALIRQGIDEPSVNAKYTDNDLLTLGCNAWTQIWTDLLAVEDHAPRGRITISIAKDTQNYVLPPNMERVERVYKLEATTGLPQWEIYPRGRFNPGGNGMIIEGNILRLTPKPDVAFDAVVDFIPGGSIAPVEGTCDTVTTAGQMTIASITAGSEDYRANAYVGYMLRVTDTNGFTDERYITGYTRDSSSSTLTFSPNLESDFIKGATDTFELVPQFGISTLALLATQVSRKIVAQEGNTKRFTLLTQLYREEMRNMRMKTAKLMERRASRMEGDSVDNARYRPMWQMGVPTQ